MKKYKGLGYYNLTTEDLKEIDAYFLSIVKISKMMIIEKK